MDELKKLKAAIKKMLLLAKNIVIERNYLGLLPIAIPQPPQLNIKSNQSDYYEFVGKFVETDALSPFLISEGIENRSVFLFEEFNFTLKTSIKQSFTGNKEEKINEKYVHSKIDKICG